MPKASLRHYACGGNIHELSQVYKGCEREQRTFPAGVFLFEHANGQRVLYDTGYAPSMHGTGWFGRLYSKILKPIVNEGETVDKRLESDGIDPRSIGHVVLSHLHPDHIGGMRYFPESTFVLSEQTHASITNHRLRDGVVTQLIPEWFDDAPKIILSGTDLDQPSGSVVDGYDLFDDESYILTGLPGHAAGHIGALVNSQALLAGDASWGVDLLPHSDQLKVLPRFITHDFNAYVDTANKLQVLASRGIAIHLSHDAYDQQELLG